MVETRSLGLQQAIESVIGKSLVGFTFPVNMTDRRTYILYASFWMAEEAAAGAVMT